MDGRHLIVFADAAHARHAGFRGARHAGDPELLAWWPGLGEDALRGYRFARVTVTDNAHRDTCGRRVLEDALQRGLHTARMMLRVEPKLWMEL